jgi:hypothetical protein
MKRSEFRILWGLLLILAGVIFLLESLAIIDLEKVWPIIFAIPGAIFLYVFLRNPDDWWAVIPGFTLLGLTALIGMEELLPRAGGDLGAGIFLGSIGLSFLVIFFTTRAKQWWAIIPAGTLITLGLVVGFETILGGEAVGGLFMLGLGLTFGLLYFLPTPEGRMKWALIPAGVLALIGVLLLTAAVDLFKYVWPAALVVAGAYLIYRALRVSE